MPYRLKLGEPLADGVRRISIEQIDRASAKLAGKNRDTGIHKARKCFKRVRALLDMSRPALKPKDYRRENRRFRDFGRALAGARDIHVMHQTLDRLQQRRDLSAAGRVPVALRAWLQANRNVILPAQGEGVMRQAQEALAGAREVFAALPVRADELAPLSEGFREIYAGGRKAMEYAYRAGVEDEAFHEWRKHVQRHWRQLQLLQNAWPEAIAPRIELASELADIIGLDHDLAVLIAFTRRNRAILGARGEVKAFVQAARDEQAHLRAAAHLRGQRLYDLPPRAIARMIETNWVVAQAMAVETPEADTASPKANVVALAQA